MFGQKSWAAVLASERFVIIIMRTWHAWTVHLTTTEKKPGCRLLRNQQMLEMGEDSCTQWCEKLRPGVCLKLKAHSRKGRPQFRNMDA